MSDNISLIDLIHSDCIAGAMEMIKAGKELDLVDGTGNSPLHLAVIKKQPTLLALLLEKGADAELKNSDELTPLLLAVKESNIECAELLIKGEADSEAVGPDGFTPLLFAVSNELDGIISLLIEKGVELNYKSEAGLTALLLALSSEERALNLLQKGADPLTTDGNNFPLVFLVLSKGYQKLALEFIKCGVDIHYRTADLKTLLQAAAYFGNREIVKLLLEQGAEIDSRDREGNSPLLLAVRGGYSEIVELLLEHGADDSFPADNYELFPLYKAVYLNNTGILKLLLMKGEHSQKDLSRWSFVTLDRALRGGSPELIDSLIENEAANFLSGEERLYIFELSCEKGYPPAVRYFLENYKELCREINGQPVYPLHKAAAGGHDEVVELLLEGGVDADRADGEGLPPFYYALEKGADKLCKLLLEQNIGLELLFTDNRGEKSSYLIKAIKGRNFSIACELVKRGVPLEERFEDKKSALYYALESQSSELLDCMIKRGVELNYMVKDRHGKTILPFYYALEYSSEESLLRLLEVGAEWSRPSFLSFMLKDKTPLLHKVIKLSYYRVAQKLIFLGEKASARDCVGKSALHYAVRDGELELLKEMLKQAPSALTIVDRQKRGLLHEAIKYDRVKIAAFLLEKGAPSSVQDRDGKTALYWANSVEAAELMLSCDALLNMRDKDGRTALSYIMQPTVSSCLLARGANVNSVDDYGRTPIFQAVINNNFEMVELLLSHNANTGLKDNMDKLPLDYARSAGVEELLRKQRGSD